MKDRIKQLRKSLKLTQNEFGEKIGMVGSAITKYEKGERGLSDAVIKSICREFHVREEWLRTGIGDMMETTPEDLIAQIAKENNFGPGRVMFLRVIVQALDALGEEAVNQILTESLPQMRREAHDLFGSTTAKLSEQASASDDHDSRQESEQ